MSTSTSGAASNRFRLPSIFPCPRSATTCGFSTLAAAFPVRVLNLRGGPSGAAYARNRGAEAAGGEILLFLDADIAVPPDTLAKVAASFTGTSAEAVFGSCDTTPEPGFISQ